MQDKWALFQKFLITQNVDISISDLLLSALTLVVLCLILEFTYIKCAKSISNKRMFAHNFLIIAFTTMVIIYIVKSSLALSLGLVGALSIVRFRSAIKEPEELSYLFLTIAIGLGLGANQLIVTITSTAIIIGIIWIRFLFSKKPAYKSLFMTVCVNEPNGIDLTQVVQVVKETFNKLEIKRYDENQDILEVSFVIDNASADKLSKSRKELFKLSQNVQISFVDNLSY